jgi:hypothetical protein
LSFILSVKEKVWRKKEFLYAKFCSKFSLAGFLTFALALVSSSVFAV